MTGEGERWERECWKFDIIFGLIVTKGLFKEFINKWFYLLVSVNERERERKEALFYHRQFNSPTTLNILPPCNISLPRFAFVGSFAVSSCSVYPSRKLLVINFMHDKLFIFLCIGSDAKNKVKVRWEKKLSTSSWTMLFIQSKGEHGEVENDKKVSNIQEELSHSWCQPAPLTSSLALIDGDVLSYPSRTSLRDRFPGYPRRQKLTWADHISSYFTRKNNLFIEYYGLHGGRKGKGSRPASIVMEKGTTKPSCFRM